MTLRTLAPTALAALMLAAPVAVHAQASDPAVPTVEVLNDGLIAAMKQGRAGAPKVAWPGWTAPWSAPSTWVP